MRLGSCAMFAAIFALAACGGMAPTRAIAQDAPPLAEFCREAQHIIERTDRIGELVVHADAQAFTKSKTSIEPLTIHQYIWYADEAKSRPLMISCKLKSADHLNAAFGAGTAGAEGDCQDMNRLTVERVERSLPADRRGLVVLDPKESVFDEANPGAAGPLWLKPDVLAERSADGRLVIHAKGFVVAWNDPRFTSLDGKFRGVHYCHLIAPDYLRDLLMGTAQPGIAIGREVAVVPPSGMSPQIQPGSQPGTGPADPPAPQP